jgi:tRNA dimethylallyltransferase
LDNKTVIIILGPTAAGKTAVGFQLAKYFQTSIISADSRQCFRELNIGVAKPSSEELELVPHHFINSHSILDEVNAALFERQALQWVDNLFLEKNTVIMVGGTGLYIRAFCEGLDEIPAVDTLLRQEIKDKYAQNGLLWLQEELKKNDPEYYASTEIKNPQRLMRALEVKLFTHHSISTFRTKTRKTRSFNIVKVGLRLEKAELHQNIKNRTERMMEMGLLEEVQSLLPFRHLNPLQTVGYSELFDYLDGKYCLAESVERINRNTRQFAKRQMTWFGKDPSVRWIPPAEWEQLKK